MGFNCCCCWGPEPEGVGGEGRDWGRGKGGDRGFNPGDWAIVRMCLLCVEGKAGGTWAGGRIGGLRKWEGRI